MTPQLPIQSEIRLLQNVRQISKPSAQQKTLNFAQFETLLTRHLEKKQQCQKNLNHTWKKSKH